MIAWRCAPFGELTGRDVHDILQARAAVFVVEQGCAFQDVDGADLHAWHLMGTLAPGLRRGDVPPGVAPAQAGAQSSRQLVAYARLIPAGIKFAEPSIGRVITTDAVRGTGVGRALMLEALRQAEKLWPGKALRIGAQQRLEAFYRSLGFATASAPYDEDGIPHVEMVRPASAVPDTAAQTVGH